MKIQNGNSSNMATSAKLTEVIIGRTSEQNYDEVIAIVNDVDMERGGGLSKNTILEVPFSPVFANVPSGPGSVVLRVESVHRGFQRDDNNVIKFDHFVKQYGSSGDITYDPLTQNMLQFGYVKCRIEGVRFQDNEGVQFGQDIDGFTSLAGDVVIKPLASRLERIINHCDPKRRRESLQQWTKMGVQDPPPDNLLGHVRESATRVRALHGSIDPTSFYIPATDILGRRTVIVGKTRTGKTNAANVIISNVFMDTGGNGGFIVFDLSGEYSNQHKSGSTLYECFPESTDRFSLKDKPGFRPVNINFYEEPEQGILILRSLLEHQPGSLSQDGQTIIYDVDWAEPEPGDYRGKQLYKRYVSALKCCLFMAGFPLPAGQRVLFEINEKTRKVMDASFGYLSNPAEGMDLPTACEYLVNLRSADRSGILPVNSVGKSVVDECLKSVLNILARENNNGTRINGFKVLGIGMPYHSPIAHRDAAQEIYDLAAAGRIVVIDLSMGEHFLKDHIAKRIAKAVLSRSMAIFNSYEVPPFITIVAEEAHNLIRADLSLDDVWPKIAKEGAKFGIGLIAITQEISSLHKNILAGCENWLIFHFNNEHELNALANYEDFRFFLSSIRCDDVGFARVRTYSRRITTSVQLTEFSPLVTKPEED